MAITESDRILGTLRRGTAAADSVLGWLYSRDWAAERRTPGMARRSRLLAMAPGSFDRSCPGSAACERVSVA